MCGIVGLLAGPSDPTIDLRDAAELMSRALAHRGPDDSGLWVDEGLGVALGHRRLSIVDLSPAGHQPMLSADGRWVLVLNGEIYDHARHRDALHAAGVAFRGTSDTEVLLALIAAHGVQEAVSSVDGMFALAAWDRRENELWLARDRLGEKPLYYGRLGGTVAFASELSGLDRLPFARRAVHPDAVAGFLRFGFVPSPLSIRAGIRKLPPGTVLRVEAGGTIGEPVAYWELAQVAERGLHDPLTDPDDALVDRADALLRASLRRRLVADVPVGAFLSGGVDSSTIVALAQAVSERPLRTFTVAVGGDADESSAAALIARHLGTDHTTLPLPEVDALAMANHVVQIYDEPFADPSAIPTALLCAAAREHVTVALSGDGGDELLAGYNRYRIAHGALSQLWHVPRPIRSALATPLSAAPVDDWKRLARWAPIAVPDVGTKLQKLAGVLKASDAPAAYLSLASQWDPAALLVEPPPDASTAWASRPGMPPLEAMLLADQQRTLPDDMLVKVDRASMAVALEVRVPFLDHRFVELSWRLPQRAKVRNGRGKWLVRRILERYVPATLWDRPKMGFDPPLADWLRGPLGEWGGDLLSPERLRQQGLVRAEPIERAWAEHQSGQRNHDYLLWTILMLQAWLDEKGE